MQEATHDTSDLAAPAGTLTHSLVNLPEPELARGLPPQVFAVLTSLYGAMLLTLWVFFGTDTNAMIALGVGTVYFAMYFGVPFAMLRLSGDAANRSQPGSLRRFLDDKVDTYTGLVSGWVGIAQIMTIPVGLTGAFIAIGLIARLTG